MLVSIDNNNIKKILENYIKITKDYMGNPIIIGIDRAILEMECVNDKIGDKIH